MMLFRLPTLIKADVPTPNMNVYSREVIEAIVKEANDRIDSGSTIPVCDPITSADIADMRGVVKALSLNEDTDPTMEATVEIFNEDMIRLIESHGEATVLNTMVEASDDGSYIDENNVRVIRKATMKAICPTTYADAIGTCEESSAATTFKVSDTPALSCQELCGCGKPCAVIDEHEVVGGESIHSCDVLLSAHKKTLHGDVTIGCKGSCGCGMPCTVDGEHAMVAGESLHSCDVHWPDQKYSQEVLKDELIDGACLKCSGTGCSACSARHADVDGALSKQLSEED